MFGNQKLKEEILSKEKQISLLHSQIKDLETKIQTSVHQLDVAQQQVKELTDSNEEKKIQIQEYREKTNHFHETINQLQGKTESLGKQLNASDEVISSLRNKVSISESTIEKQKKELKRITKDLDIINQQNVLFKAEAEKNKKKQLEDLQRFRDLQKRVDEYKEKQEQQDKRLTESEEKVYKLNNEIEKKSNQIKQFRDQTENNKEKQTQQANLITQLEKEIHRLEDELVEKDDSIKQLMEQLEKNKKENKSLPSFKNGEINNKKAIKPEKKNWPDYLQQLNSEQIEAVTSTEGYVRVIAGAGSGKTRALTNRYVYLVEHLGISPSSILCVTFTNKAANEMKKRISQLIGAKDLSMICTFHSFCVQVLRSDARKINYPNNFMILDTTDSDAIIKKVYSDNNISPKDLSYKRAREIISMFKISGPHSSVEKKIEKQEKGYIDYLASSDSSELMIKYKESARERSNLNEIIIWGYVYEQKKNYGLDFNDLILCTLYIFGHCPDVLDIWQKRLEYIMVDEFQDISASQYALCDLLQEYHKNLFVVGDPDQTIYSFRGARIERILDFDKYYPGTKTIMMNSNYRSAPNIIQVSNDLISKNLNRIKKDLIPIKTEDTPTIYYHSKSTIEEAETIAQIIEELRQKEIPLNSIAVLYRAHFVSRSIEDALMEHNIQYTIYSGISFYERKEIKDILSYLRMLIYQDDYSFLRTVNEPKRNIGESRIKLIRDYAEEHNCSMYNALKYYVDSEHSLFVRGGAYEYITMIEKYRLSYKQYTITDLLEEIMRDSGYEKMIRAEGEDERLENVAELKKSIVEYENQAGESFGLEDYLSKIALLTNIDKTETTDTVKLMTVHNAKGLEFPVVIVCGLNEGIFPSRKIRTYNELEEERRLAYVAFTRAESALVLTDAEGINYDNSFRYPSRFIFDICKNHLLYWNKLDDALIENANVSIEKDNQKFENMDVFNYINAGMKINHPAFGIGKIKKYDEALDEVEVQFENGKTRHFSKTGLSACEIMNENSVNQFT